MAVGCRIYHQRRSTLRRFSLTNWEELKLAFFFRQVGYLILAETLFIVAIAMRGLPGRFC